MVGKIPIPLGSKTRTLLLLYVLPKKLLPSSRLKSSLISPSPVDSPTAPSTKGTISLLQYRPFEKVENSNRFYLTVLARKASTDHITFPNSLSSDPPS